MQPEFNNDRPIYLQIADSIENDIIKDIIEEESQIPSTKQMAILYKINPATAGKGINMLVDQGILYKKRGIGMFVSTGAKRIIKKKENPTSMKSILLHFWKKRKILTLESMNL